MVHPKYSPEEALQRVKLMMKYDSSKTLNENITDCSLNQLNEQLSSCPNSIPYGDVRESAEETGQKAFRMSSAFNRMFYAEERAQEIYDSIKQVVGKNTWDDIDEKCVPATEVYDKFFKKGSESMLGWYGGNNVSKSLTEIIKNDYVKNNFPEAIRIIQKAKKLWDNSTSTTPAPVVPPVVQPTSSDRQKNINLIFCSVKNGIIVNPGSSFNNKQWSSWVSTYKPTNEELEIAKNSCKRVNDGVRSKYAICSETLPIKMYCKNSTVAKVQGCLGMPSKYQTGNFGPITSQSLISKGLDGQSITQATIDKVCGGGTPIKQGAPGVDAGEEETGEVSNVKNKVSSPTVVSTNDADETS